jgi:hypothetical protein
MSPFPAPQRQPAEQDQKQQKKVLRRKMPQSLAGVVLTDYNGGHSVALPPWRSGRCDLAKNAVSGYGNW